MNINSSIGQQVQGNEVFVKPFLYKNVAEEVLTKLDLKALLSYSLVCKASHKFTSYVSKLTLEAMLLEAFDSIENYCKEYVKKDTRIPACSRDEFAENMIEFQRFLNLLKIDSVRGKKDFSLEKEKITLAKERNNLSLDDKKFEAMCVICKEESKTNLNQAMETLDVAYNTFISAQIGNSGVKDYYYEGVRKRAIDKKDETLLSICKHFLDSSLEESKLVFDKIQGEEGKSFALLAFLEKKLESFDKENFNFQSIEKTLDSTLTDVEKSLGCTLHEQLKEFALFLIAKKKVEIFPEKTNEVLDSLLNSMGKDMSLGKLMFFLYRATLNPDLGLPEEIEIVAKSFMGAELILIIPQEVKFNQKSVKAKIDSMESQETKDQALLLLFKEMIKTDVAEGVKLLKNIENPSIRIDALMTLLQAQKNNQIDFDDFFKEELISYVS